MVTTKHHGSTKTVGEIGKNRPSLSTFIVDFVAEHKRNKVMLQK